MSQQTYRLQTDNCIWTLSFIETDTHIIEVMNRTGNYTPTPQGMEQYMTWLISIPWDFSKPTIKLEFVNGVLIESRVEPSEELVDDTLKSMVARMQDTVDAVGRKKYYKDMVAKSKMDDRYVVYPDGSIQLHPLMKITKSGIIEYSEA